MSVSKNSSIKERNRTKYSWTIDINQTKCIIDQNVKVPTVFGEKTWKTKKLKGQSIFGLKLFGRNIAWTKCKGTKCLHVD